MGKRRNRKNKVSKPAPSRPARRGPTQEQIAAANARERRDLEILSMNCIPRIIRTGSAIPTGMFPGVYNTGPNTAVVIQPITRVPRPTPVGHRFPPVTHGAHVISTAQGRSLIRDPMSAFQTARTAQKIRRTSTSSAYPTSGSINSAVSPGIASHHASFRCHSSGYTSPYEASDRDSSAVDISDTQASNNGTTNDHLSTQGFSNNGVPSANSSGNNAASTTVSQACPFTLNATRSTRPRDISDEEISPPRRVRRRRPWHDVRDEGIRIPHLPPGRRARSDGGMNSPRRTPRREVRFNEQMELNYFNNTLPPNSVSPENIRIVSMPSLSQPPQGNEEDDGSSSQHDYGLPPLLSPLASPSPNEYGISPDLLEVGSSPRQFHAPPPGYARANGFPYRFESPDPNPPSPSSPRRLAMLQARLRSSLFSSMDSQPHTSSRESEASDPHKNDAAQEGPQTNDEFSALAQNESTNQLTQDQLDGLYDDMLSKEPKEDAEKEVNDNDFSELDPRLFTEELGTLPDSEAHAAASPDESSDIDLSQLNPQFFTEELEALSDVEARFAARLNEAAEEELAMAESHQPYDNNNDGDHSPSNPGFEIMEPSPPQLTGSDVMLAQSSSSDPDDTLLDDTDAHTAGAKGADENVPVKHQ